MKFRKKPVVIDAYQIQAISAITEPAPAWLLEAVLNGTVKPLDGCGLHIHTLEGVMHGGVGDWVIKGVKGELYPCKPDIFAATYEPVTPNG